MRKTRRAPWRRTTTRAPAGLNQGPQGSGAHRPCMLLQGPCAPPPRPLTLPWVQDAHQLVQQAQRGRRRLPVHLGLQPAGAGRARHLDAGIASRALAGALASLEALSPSAEYCTAA